MQNAFISILRETAKQRAWQMRLYFLLREISKDQGGAFKPDWGKFAEELNVSERTVASMRGLLVKKGYIYRVKIGWWQITSLHTIAKEKNMSSKYTAEMPRWALESKEAFRSFITSAYSCMRVKAMNRPKKEYSHRDKTYLKSSKKRGTSNVGFFAGTLLAEDLGLSPQQGRKWMKAADGKFQKITSRRTWHFKYIQQAMEFIKSEGGKLIEVAGGWLVQLGYIRAFCVKVKRVRCYKGIYSFHKDYESVPVGTL